MKPDEQLLKRSENKCELCQSGDTLEIYEVLPAPKSNSDNRIVICDKCRAQIDKKAELDSNHWSCLSTAIWSEVPGIQVVSRRMLNRLKDESWAMDHLDMMYLNDETLTWAKAAGDHDNDGIVELHKDSSGNVLQKAEYLMNIITRG
jgi:protein PhnA